MLFPSLVLWTRLRVGPKPPGKNPAVPTAALLGALFSVAKSEGENGLLFNQFQETYERSFNFVLRTLLDGRTYRSVFLLMINTHPISIQINGLRSKCRRLCECNDAGQHLSLLQSLWKHAILSILHKNILKKGNTIHKLKEKFQTNCWPIIEKSVFVLCICVCLDYSFLECIILAREDVMESWSL